MPAEYKPQGSPVNQHHGRQPKEFGGLRHTTEEVQGLRASLEKAQKELEEQRLAHAGQQRTSTQVEEEQQAQLTALERARNDTIESLNDLREDLDRSSSRTQVQSETIEVLRRQLEDARDTIRATERTPRQLHVRRVVQAYSHCRCIGAPGERPHHPLAEGQSLQ